MKQLRILVAEDEAVVAMDIEERLDRLGYEPVGRATCGHQAVALATQLRPDTVLMDIRLDGGVDGITAAHEIRRGLHAPVVFLTAYADDETLRRARLAEPYGYIIKPFKDLDLKSAIEIAHHKHQAEREIHRLNRILDVPGRLDDAIMHCRSRQELFDTVCRLAVERGSVDFAWIGWLEPGTTLLTPVASFGRDQQLMPSTGFWGDERPAGPGIPARALREGGPLFSDACSSLPHLPFATPPSTPFHFRSCGSFPLRFQGRVCGALTLSTADPDFLTDREIHLVEEMTRGISFMLDKMEADVRQRQAEAAIRESERRYRAVIEHVSEVIFTVDNRGHVTPINTPSTRATAEEALEALAVSAGEAGPPVPLSAEVARVLDTGRSRQCEIHVRARGAAPSWYEVNLSPVQEDGFVERVVLVMRDVTERKALEARLQQAQKMEAVGRLAGGVAHDFNNMLGVILGYAELALHKVDPGHPLHRHLEQIEKSATRSADLTRQLLTFACKQTITPRVLDLNGTVAATLPAIRRVVGEDIDLQWQPALNLWPVRADPSQVDQILTNLCVNARGAITPGGRITITTGNRAVDEACCVGHAAAMPGDFVSLSVSDDGCGMDPETLAHVFEPFYTTQGVGRGTGLGLATVYGVVEQNRGFIRVESQPGQGTTFTIYLPRCAEQAEQRQAEHPVRSVGGGRETILLVEDEPALLELTTTMLEARGYRVLAAGTPNEAIRLAREHADPIHLLTTDVIMPGMNGRDLARTLQAIRPGLKCLFVSGYTAEVIAPRGILDEAVFFIQKPFSADCLATRIREILDHP